MIKLASGKICFRYKNFKFKMFYCPLHLIRVKYEVLKLSAKLLKVKFYGNVICIFLQKSASQVIWVEVNCCELINGKLNTHCIIV